MACCNSLILLVIGIAMPIKNCVNRDTIDLDSFPDNFLIGTASSSYQIEGAWNVSGKSENIWDYFTHNKPEKIRDRSNGDVSCSSYYKYKEDIALLKSIGVDHYRFSLSWSRILPTGYVNVVNKEGIKYYHDILDELERNNIIPMITIYHWDHPQALEKLGGWLNEEMAYIFADYARFVFKEFGNRVKIFTTINEPNVFCSFAYKDAIFAPGSNEGLLGQYLCVHNMLKGHAGAYHIYDKEFRQHQNGQIGIVVHAITPYSKNETDKEATDIFFEFNVGWQMHPIFSKTGDYPLIMKQMIAQRSKLQGYYRSKLPIYSDSWIEFIRGSADFVGLNHYTSKIVTPLSKSSELEWPNDMGLEMSNDPSWPSSQSDWLKSNPKGLADILRMIKNKYENPLVYILENGVSDGSGIDDHSRVKYLCSYMKEMLIAIKKDECNVKAYTVWSFLDSFEWDTGYTNQFGLVNVNFKDENLVRTPKKSALWLQNVLKTRKLQCPTET